MTLNTGARKRVCIGFGIKIISDVDGEVESDDDL